MFPQANDDSRNHTQWKFPQMFSFFYSHEHTQEKIWYKYASYILICDACKHNQKLDLAFARQINYIIHHAWQV